MSPTPIVFEQIVNAPINAVWRALTDKDQMKDWYFELAEFKPEVGFEFQFMGGTEENSYLHLCRITEVETGRKLSHTWVYDGYAGASSVTFELFPVQPDKTRVVLTHAGLETLPQDNPDFARKNFEEGWKHIIGISLPEYLEKNASASSR